jgi:hypothetical protein
MAINGRMDVPLFAFSKNACPQIREHHTDESCRTAAVGVAKSIQRKKKTLSVSRAVEGTQKYRRGAKEPLAVIGRSQSTTQHIELADENIGGPGLTRTGDLRFRKALLRSQAILAYPT